MESKLVQMKTAHLGKFWKKEAKNLFQYYWYWMVEDVSSL